MKKNCGRTHIKMYIAVFVCFTSKLVHLKKFIGRKGIPDKLYSQPRASRKQNECCTRPNHSPQQRDGVRVHISQDSSLRRAVRSSPEVRKESPGEKTVGKALLTPELEAILNSRSICSVSQ